MINLALHLELIPETKKFPLYSYDISLPVHGSYLAGSIFLTDLKVCAIQWCHLFHFRLQCRVFVFSYLSDVLYVHWKDMCYTLHTQFGLNPLQIGLLFLPYVIINVPLGLAVGRLSDKFVSVIIPVFCLWFVKELPVHKL